MHGHGHVHGGKLPKPHVGTVNDTFSEASGKTAWNGQIPDCVSKRYLCTPLQGNSPKQRRGESSSTAGVPKGPALDAFMHAATNIGITTRLLNNNN